MSTSTRWIATSYDYSIARCRSIAAELSRRVGAASMDPTYGAADYESLRREWRQAEACLEAVRAERDEAVARMLANGTTRA